MITAKVLAFIDQHIAERGYPPTLREIADEFGWSSTNACRYHLRRLEKAGYVERQPRLSRGLRRIGAKKWHG